MAREPNAASPENDEQRPALHITLTADGVMAPALAAMKLNSEILSLTLATIDNADLDDPPDLPTGFFRLKFPGPNVSADDRRAAYGSWLLAKGFQDISRGVRESLEAAYIFIECVNLPDQRSTIEVFRNIQKSANGLPFPELLNRVNDGLSDPLHFEQEFLSLQKVRNCLEHRNGVVSEKDINHENRFMRLSLPRLKMFIEREGEEVELYPNMRVEAGELVVFRREIRERDFRVGERITFNAAEFDEIASACFFFANDLGHKLPSPA